ncbi:MAG: metal-dependent hydrolase [Candidatus Omnitrophica bacterium]|nr:metal-dependent hydrolase [Candidatus Omnitrophota bacterium]
MNKAPSPSRRFFVSLFRFFPLFFTAVLSHAVLDYFDGPPKGVALFWPFSSKMFYAPVSIFGGKGGRSPLEDLSGINEFFHYVFSAHCFFDCLYELGLIFAVFALYKIGKAAREPVHIGESVAFASLAVLIFWVRHVL